MTARGLERARLALFLAGALCFGGERSASAACTLTNLDRFPLCEQGYKVYHGYATGLYPNYGNNRPPSHLAAAVMIATNQIKPLDAHGDVNENTGKIVLLSIGMSNTTHEWASGSNDGGGTSYTFRSRANADPSKNPQLVVVDGAQGGQDATRWTNLAAATWTNVLARLKQSGVTTNQVQAVWLKQSLQNITQYGGFPEAALELEQDLEIIVRNLKTLYPHIQLAFVSSRTRCWTTNDTATNPEPYSWEVGFATKWMIEKQINGASELNWDPAKGQVVAPLLSWGPYLWADGTTPRGDGLTSQSSDVVSDCTHPSSSGVYKVASQLLAFFKTDPAATPWFLRNTDFGVPPSCTAVADATNGVVPLTVHFSAAISGSVTQAVWTFDDGESAIALNPTNIYQTPGTYIARVTVTDTNGNIGQSSVNVVVDSTFGFWRTNKFTNAELTNEALSGAAANPDADAFPNLLEYAMGLEPKTSNPTSVARVALSNDVFTLSFPHCKAAADVALSAEVSSDASNWSAIAPTQTLDSGPIETLIVQETLQPGVARYFRLKATR